MKRKLTYENIKIGDSVRVFDPRTEKWKHPISTIYTVKRTDCGKQLYRTSMDKRDLQYTLRIVEERPEYTQIELLK